MFLNLPEEGERVEINERFGDIESVKTVSDLISPVTGKVVSVNEDLLENLENISDIFVCNFKAALRLSIYPKIYSGVSTLLSAFNRLRTLLSLKYW